MKKIVINIGSGIWELSPKAMKRLAELRGLTPMFIRMHGVKGLEIQPEHIQESYSWITYDRNTLEPIDDGVYNREDVNLIKVIEELGSEANWEYSKLKVVDVPDNPAEYTIISKSEYGGGPETIIIK